MKLRPKYARYYDLIRVPHGHIPAPMTNFWSKLPIPVKEFRTGDFYSCPICGGPNFFKINYACWWCQNLDDYQEYAYQRYKQRKRREYFRELWKKLEYIFLPLLILFGKAWYVKSKRLHVKDFSFYGSKMQ